MDLEEMRKRAEDVLGCPTPTEGALAADVLTLIAEVERLRGENSTLMAMEEHTREERDAASDGRRLAEDQLHSVRQIVKAKEVEYQALGDRTLAAIAERDALKAEVERLREFDPDVVRQRRVDEMLDAASR